MSERRTSELLSVRGLTVNYGPITAVRNVSLHVGEGEIVALLGPNGAGKTSVLRGVTALVRPAAGRVRMAGRRVDDPSRAVALCIAHVPEGRRVFPGLSVRDNLLVGGWAVSGRAARLREREALVLDLFPRLAERHDQRAGQLSGGEQQMLAIGRALMARPSFLLLDEPSLGLAPLLVTEVFRIIRQLADEGTTILLVEQMANQALAVADRAYVLESGSITAEGAADAVREDPRVKAAYLGA